jgi:hypothetical protein
VILRAWRKGSDIMGEAERIVRDAEKKFKRDEQRGEASQESRSSSGKASEQK